MFTLTVLWHKYIKQKTKSWYCIGVCSDILVLKDLSDIFENSVLTGRPICCLCPSDLTYTTPLPLCFMKISGITEKHKIPKEQ